MVGEPLDRCPAALRLRHHLHDLREHGVRADLRRAHGEAAGLVDSAPDYLIARAFLDGNGLATDHGFVDGTASILERAIDGDLVARTHAQKVPRRQFIKRNFALVPATENLHRGRGRELEKRPQGARCGSARLEFEHLPEQHEGRDNRCCLVIDADPARMIAESLGKDVRGEGCHKAEQISDGNAEADQGEHVEVHGSD